MKWKWPWMLRHREVVEERDHEGNAWSERVLRESGERLQRDHEEIVVPLRRMRERNNVTAVARYLLRGSDEHGPSAAH